MRLVVFRNARSRAVEYIGGVIQRVAFFREYAARNDVDTEFLGERSTERLGARAVLIRLSYVELFRRKARVPEFGQQDDVRLALCRLPNEQLRAGEVLLRLCRANVHLNRANLHGRFSFSRARRAFLRILS